MPPADLGRSRNDFAEHFQEIITNTIEHRHTLIPPRGYSIAGIYGSCGPWIDGFGLIITR